jgi:hypothetical protein
MCPRHDALVRTVPVVRLGKTRKITGFEVSKRRGGPP